MNIDKILLSCIAFFLFACKAIPVENKEAIAPKNVILLISDGTGLSQISSAYYYKESSPNYSRFKNIGLIKTSSSKQDVTDSAAGATAFASGIKTYNGAIGVADDKTAAENLVEIVSRKNLKTGLVATSSITHATPASFFAHVVSRGLTEDIAAELVTSEVDFFAGGGLKFFKDRKDGKNLLDALAQNQFSVYTSGLNDFSQIKSDQKVGYLLSDDAMPTIEKGRGDFLSQATTQAIQYLDQEKAGFFLMSEGSQIDWGGHSNDASYLIAELIDFDDAIGQALDFAEKDGNTLVIVTSDHETGGFTLSAKKKTNEEGKEYSDYTEIGPTFSTGGHSATLIPVFAFGPGSEVFNGVYENNEIFHKILQVTKWKD